MKRLNNIKDIYYNFKVLLSNMLYNYHIKRLQGDNMNYLNVKFLEKEYQIPKDLLEYLDLLDLAESVKNNLMRAFYQACKKNDVGCIDDEDLHPEMTEQISIFIKKLCDKGIYNRTVNDYLLNNKGYQLFSLANKNAFNKIKQILQNRLDALQVGYEDALNKRDASITGMGFSVISNSFVNHAIYAAMEASTLTKQEKEANEQYKRDIGMLIDNIQSKYGKEQTNYIQSIYIPSIESALTSFSYGLRV